MKSNRCQCYAALILLLLVTSINAQEFADPLARQLTDFLPTYTPFMPPEPPDRYFPDAVGKLVAEAVTDGYLQNAVAVKQKVQELQRHDVALAAADQPPTGVTLPVYALTQRSLDDVENDRGIAALNASPDELLARADEFLANEKRGRVGRMFNWMLSSLDVASLLLGVPRGPSPYSAQGIISGWGDADEPSPGERKALAFYREFLRRAPEDPRAEEVVQRIEQLDKRRKQALVQAEIARAEAAYEKQDYWRANFHYQLALLADEESADAYTGLEKVEASLRKEKPLDRAQAQDDLADVKAAQWERNKETLMYVLPGSHFVKDNIVVAGVQVTTEGLVGAATFGALTAIQTASKLFQTAFGNPVSQQGVITEAEKYLRETPEVERTPEVYAILAKAYEKEGHLDKAITYTKLAGDLERVPQLEERAGATLREMAEQSTSQGEKETYLRALIERFPSTKAAREARPKLRELNLSENQGLHMSKAFLKENFDLVGPQGLGLKRELFDGDKDNVELVNDGITLLPSGEVTLRLESEQGPRTKVYAVPDVSWSRFWSRFRERGYQLAAQRGDYGLAMIAQGAETADTTLKSEDEKNEGQGWRLLPYIAGSLSGTDLDVHSTLPKELIGVPLTFGNDRVSSYLGVEVPMPFVPVDFLLLGRNGAPSLYPRIRLPEAEIKDAELYQ